MRDLVYHSRRVAMSHGIEQLLRLSARREPDDPREDTEVAAMLSVPRHPEDFAPLQNRCF